MAKEISRESRSGGSQSDTVLMVEIVASYLLLLFAVVLFTVLAVGEFVQPAKGRTAVPEHQPTENVLNSADDRPTASSDEAAQTGAVTTNHPDDKPTIAAGESRLADREPMETVGIDTAGQPLVRTVRLDGRERLHAIWTRPDQPRGTAQISYQLGGRYRQLRGMAGLADAAAANADKPPSPVVFRIYGDGNLLWETEAIRAAGENKEFAIDVAGLDLLALTCESLGETADAAACWVDVRLTE
jgi:hypothetical protein